MPLKPKRNSSKTSAFKIKVKKAFLDAPPQLLLKAKRLTTRATRYGSLRLLVWAVLRTDKLIQNTSFQTLARFQIKNECSTKWKIKWKRVQLNPWSAILKF
jgi:hypothetical protein